MFIWFAYIERWPYKKKITTEYNFFTPKFYSVRAQFFLNYFFIKIRNWKVCLDGLFGQYTSSVIQNIKKLKIAFHCIMYGIETSRRDWEHRWFTTPATNAFQTLSNTWILASPYVLLPTFDIVEPHWSSQSLPFCTFSHSLPIVAGRYALMLLLSVQLLPINHGTPRFTSLRRKSKDIKDHKVRCT